MSCPCESASFKPNVRIGARYGKASKHSGHSCPHPERLELPKMIHRQRLQRQFPDQSMGVLLKIGTRFMFEGKSRSHGRSFTSTASLANREVCRTITVALIAQIASTSRTAIRPKVARRPVRWLSFISRYSFAATPVEVATGKYGVILLRTIGRLMPLITPQKSFSSVPCSRHTPSLDISPLIRYTRKILMESKGSTGER